MWRRTVPALGAPTAEAPHGISNWHRDGEDGVGTILGQSWPDNAQKRHWWIRGRAAFLSLDARQS